MAQTSVQSSERGSETDGEFSSDTEQMRAAVGRVVAIGPDFLAGSVHADDMAHTMVAAAADYRIQGGTTDSEPAGSEGAELRAALAEIHNCGSGYLEKRCEADCVARTMTQIVHEFGALAPQG